MPKRKPVLKSKKEAHPVPPPLSALDLLWQNVLTLVQPFSTQMMLKQQCRLLAFDGWEARIGTPSQPLFKMANTRMSNLELAFGELYNHPVQARLQVVSADEWTPVVPIPPETPTPPQPVIDLPRPPDWAGSMSESRSDYGFFT